VFAAWLPDYGTHIAPSHYRLTFERLLHVDLMLFLGLFSAFDGAFRSAAE
jgi:hypothetical protein